MKSRRIEYTPVDNRGIVYEGRFIEIPSGNFVIGDWFLTHHRCKHTGARLMTKIKDILPAYTFNDETIHDFQTYGHGTYKSNLKHVSIYDGIVRTAPVTPHMASLNEMYKNMMD